jgi:hypothetical protein
MIPSNPLLFAEFLQGVAVVDLQPVPVLGHEGWPTELLGDGAWLVEGWPGSLVGHLQEQEVRELLHVIPVAHAIIPKDVAVVPELLDDQLRMITHNGCTT